MNMKIGDLAKFTVHTIAYQVVRNEALNSLLSRITGADIKQNLAEKVLADALRLAPGFVKLTNNKMLGERTSELVSLTSSLFFSNTREQTMQAIGDLVKIIIASEG